MKFNMKKTTYTWLCSDCYNIGIPKKYIKGSIWIEIILWICYIIPGVIYSLWRLSTKTSGCELCGSSNIIPSESLMAKKIIKKINETETPALTSNLCPERVI